MLYLVRHGLAAAGIGELDPGLDAVGHAQANATAAHLGGLAIGRIIASPLLRTRETAVPLAAMLSLNVEIREEVGEVFDPRLSPELRRAMIGPFMAGAWSTQDEVLRAWRQKVLDGLESISAEAASAGHDIAIFTHYIAIGVAIGQARGDDRVVPAPVANCSITTLEVTRDGFRVPMAADTAHLPANLVTGLQQAFPGGG